MRIRLGFVSNSSSATFILNSSKFSEIEFKLITDYLSDPDRNQEGWSMNKGLITRLITGYTHMDNNYFSDFLEANNLLDRVKIIGD